MHPEKSVYKRILIKLSGEALMGDDHFGINRDTIVRMVDEIAEVTRMGVELAVVIGGGNIFRGVAGGSVGMDRATADYMGMLATVMNALALGDTMNKAGLTARVMSAIGIEQVVEPYVRPKALQYLEEGKEVGIGIAVASLTKYIESIIALKKGDRKNVKHDDVAKFPSWWEFVESTNEDKEAKRMLTLASKQNVNDFLQRIKTATNPEAQHFFMTAHKSKGFEWNNVQVYGDFRFNRNKEESNPLKGMPEQEVNLLYIACTRAKLKLKLPEELEFDFV